MRQKSSVRMRILIPILLFVLLGMLLISQTALGAGIYGRSQEKADELFAGTTFSDYIRTKIESANVNGGVRIGKYGEGDALVLPDASGNSGYETVLYFQDGYLMEEYKNVDDEFSGNAGTKILKADGFRAGKISGTCVRCSMKKDGSWQDVYVYVTKME